MRFLCVLLEWFCCYFLVLGHYVSVLFCYVWMLVFFWIESYLQSMGVQSLWHLLFDWMSLVFLGLVMFISSMVVWYSDGYMAGDYNLNRFVLVVLLFVASMGFLILSPNLISILLGWDGLGLVSYCLVIYYQNARSANAGMLTALSNRVGDVALLMGICLMSCWGGWGFPVYLDVYKFDVIFMCVVGLVVLAALTKSAQIPFSAWLPAAMAAPTPVSALVHSSTLVTAGVYLLIRFSDAIMGTVFQSFLLFISGLTMFMAGLGANFENDLSKVIALSTLSQLGVMFFSLSLGLVKVAYFHLLTHALFKSLLFLCAGVVIHNVKDFQDIRSMGGLSEYMPVTISCFNVSNLALCGMPFLAGFYSKDLIIEFCSMSFVNVFSFFLIVFSTGLTVCYSFRLAYVSMFGDYSIGSLSSINDEVSVMTTPMMFLSLMAVVGGAVMSWVLFPTPVFICLSFGLKIMTLVVCILGALMGLVLSMISVLGLSSRYLVSYPFSVFFGSMWFMPGISTYGVSSPFLYGGELYYRLGDMGWNERFGSQGLYSLLSVGSRANQFMQGNLLKFYLFTLMVWFLFVMVMM
uniref:NADH-ubiquinone oxidoreductase chain 5 n=1 Tax=Japyx solifugus TaxID=296598 RepID=Q4G2Z8_JAPSO|nr:NADH dehydrogenase subunit 5 [Japyx solifugus]AAV33414.1 NADH dehydrogenase subunit 5 [Japyx solifugus]